MLRDVLISFQLALAFAVAPVPVNLPAGSAMRLANQVLRIYCPFGRARSSGAEREKRLIVDVAACFHSISILEAADAFFHQDESEEELPSIGPGSNALFRSSCWTRLTASLPRVGVMSVSIRIDCGVNWACWPEAGNAATARDERRGAEND